MSVVCRNCGGPKPDDSFRACPDCREEWRRAQRKPGGYAERIEQLTEQRDLLVTAAERVLKSAFAENYLRITPFRELQIAVDGAADQ